MFYQCINTLLLNNFLVIELSQNLLEPSVTISIYNNSIKLNVTKGAKKKIHLKTTIKQDYNITLSPIYLKKKKKIKKEKKNPCGIKMVISSLIFTFK